jgi:hypothetical protein
LCAPPLSLSLSLVFSFSHPRSSTQHFTLVQTDLEGCSYIVDMDFVGQAEPHYLQAMATWEVIYEFPFLNSAESHWFYRAFWVPYLSSQHCEFNRYFVLKRREP